MIKEVTMYTIICDGCGKDANDGTEYSCWSDQNFVECMAIDDGWIETNNEHYCPNCFSFDSEDNVVLKENKLPLNRETK